MSLLEQKLAAVKAEYNKSTKLLNEASGRILILETLAEEIEKEMGVSGELSEVRPGITIQSHIDQLDLNIYVWRQHRQFRQALKNLDLSGTEQVTDTYASNTKTIITLKGFEDIAICMLDEPIELKAAA